MENTSKALIMAGGMLMAILILSVAIAGYNQIRNSSQVDQESLTAEQIAEFNSQFEAYNRENLTGIELVSLLNKIKDYNAKNVPDGYKEMQSNLQELIDQGKDEEGKITSEFKGKKFKCNKVEYDKNTGRIIKMTFTQQ